MQRQVIDVPLAHGLNQKADTRYLELGGHAQLINCRKQKNNAIVKRPGHTALSKTVANNVAPSIAACVAGGSAHGVPWLSDGTTLNVYSDAAGQWSYVSKLPEVQVNDRTPVASIAGQFADRDYCVSGGYRLVVYTAVTPAGGGLGVYWTVLDATTGATIVPAQYVDAALSSTLILGARLSLCGTTAVLTYVVFGGSLYARSLNMATPLSGWSAATAIASDGALTLFDIGQYGASAVAGDPTRFAVAYELATPVGGKHVVIRIFHTSGFGLVQSIFNDATFSLLSNVALSSVSGGYHWVFYTASSGAADPQSNAWGVVDGSTTPTTVATVYTWPIGATSFGATTIVANGNRAVCFWCQSSASATPPIGSMQTQWARAEMVQDSAGTATTVGPTSFTQGINWASNPVVVNGVAYLLAYLPSSVQPTYYLVACDWYGNTSFVGYWPVRCAAVIAPRLGANNKNNGGLSAIPHIFNDSGSLYSVPVELATQPNHHAIYLEQFDFGGTLRHAASGDLGSTSNTAITAGQMTGYDQEIAFELGCAWYPELASTGGPPTGIVTSVSGGSMGTGTQSGIPQVYQYCLCYEWYDALGNIHRSAPSPPQTADMSGLSNGTAGSVAITFAVLGLTQRVFGSPAAAGGPTFQQTLPSEVYVVPYRTTAGETLFYRAVSDPPPASLLCSATNSTITYTDQLSDATLTNGTNPLLYTTGGFLPNMGPPGARAFCVHQGRWYLGGCDDPTAIWPSKQLTPGEVAGFHENLNLSASGAVRALASMDANLIVFVQRTDGYGVEFIAGQGPLDNGQQSDWTPPQRIPSDTGAVDQRGVCAFPGGVLFRGTVGGPNGAGGIFVLSRDFQVQYIGGPVEDTLAAFPVVTSMRLHPTAGRVYVECVNSDSAPTSGTRIVWDYIMGVWSIDQVQDFDVFGATPGARFAWIANAGVAPTYHWATAAGRVQREVTGTGAHANQDAGNQWVPMTLQTAQIKPAISQAVRFWRVQLSGDSIDPYNFTMVLTFDGAPAAYYSETLNGSSPSFTAGAIAAFDRYPQVDVEQYVGNQIAKSMTVTLTDAPPTGGPSATSGAGPSWAALSVEIGSDGSKRYPNIPAGQRG